MTLKRLLVALLVLVAVVGLYFGVVLNWSYSSGERAGWVQKLSQKGWICKTWEGELVLASMPGVLPEKFAFTVRDDAVAAQITKSMGRRISLHYEQKVGLPTSCFGDTRYYATAVAASDEMAPPAGIPAPAASAASR